nr:MAG TPA: hypothetical protein [Caudoviricetes sp.]
MGVPFTGIEKAVFLFPVFFLSYCLALPSFTPFPFLFPFSPFPTTSILHCITPVYILLYSSIVSRQGSLRGRCVEKICFLSSPEIPARDYLSEAKRHKVGQRGAGAAARPIRYGCVEMKVVSATQRLSVT